MKDVRVRIAPSPTGDPHVGTAYIALFNYALAKSNGGKFILRIEDTDQTRSNKESEKQIFDSLKWLGLNYDEGPDVGGEFGPYRQSERKDIYKDYAEQLVKKGMAYRCFCSSDRLAQLKEKQKENKERLGYDGLCKTLSQDEINTKIVNGDPYVIRLKIPNEGQTIVKDLLRGEVSFNNAEIDDQILLKTDGYPTYHLANVVDDYLMKITHVIRAEEWIPSTPKHILLYRAFGWDEPVWCHMPLLRNSDKSKISKRKNPVSLNFYKENGYLKEAMVNFLALMGWSIGEDREIFSLDEMINNFNINKVSIGGPVFDLKKLGWLNKEYINAKSLDEITELVRPFLKDKRYNIDINKNKLNRIIGLCRERAETLVELAENAEIYFADEFDLPEKTEDMNKKQRKSIDRLHKAVEADTTKEVTKLFLEKLEKLNDEISEEEAKLLLNDVLETSEEGPGKVLMPLRVIITGQAHGPDLYNVISIIGKDRVIKRVNNFDDKYNISA